MDKDRRDGIMQILDKYDEPDKPLIKKPSKKHKKIFDKKQKDADKETEGVTH